MVGLFHGSIVIFVKILRSKILPNNEAIKQ